ncbi:hypothetical protein COCOBI_16-1650 [Coccomyxa sp. Obi]|nr:hypothetical protein COCOBI_16-1650 [Coccomyxa sp. Obi]
MSRQERSFVKIYARATSAAAGLIPRRASRSFYCWLLSGIMLVVVGCQTGLFVYNVITHKTTPDPEQLTGLQPGVKNQTEYVVLVALDFILAHYLMDATKFWVGHYPNSPLMAIGMALLQVGALLFGLVQFLGWFLNVPWALKALLLPVANEVPKAIIEFVGTLKIGGTKWMTAAAFGSALVIGAVGTTFIALNLLVGMGWLVIAVKVVSFESKKVVAVGAIFDAFDKMKEKANIVPENAATTASPTSSSLSGAHRRSANTTPTQKDPADAV